MYTRQHSVSSFAILILLSQGQSQLFQVDCRDHRVRPFRQLYIFQDWGLTHLREVTDAKNVEKLFGALVSGSAILAASADRGPGCVTLLGGPSGLGGEILLGAELFWPFVNLGGHLSSFGIGGSRGSVGILFGGEHPTREVKS